MPCVFGGLLDKVDETGCMAARVLSPNQMNLFNLA